MIRRWIFAPILFCSLSLFAKVRVLSVCIGSYPEGSGWNDLSARNDNRSINALFPDAVSLIDEAATYESFARELSKLEKEVNPGDTVIIHFSGHGQQILTSASASEPDRVDEALVPYDALKRETRSYRGQNHFTDDAFGKKVSAIRDKAGNHGLVIAVIDACHSDSMDKDPDGSNEVYRGTEEIFGAENLSPDSVAALRSHYYETDKTDVDKSERKAAAIFIGACGTHQRNYEIKINGEAHGSLTYYFCKSVREKGLANPEVMLSDLYSQMTGDNVMRFHGQRPSIRTSFEWKTPDTEAYMPSTVPASPQPSESDWPLWIIVGLGAIMASVIVFVLWKRKR